MLGEIFSLIPFHLALNKAFFFHLPKLLEALELLTNVIEYSLCIIVGTIKKKKEEPA